MNGKHTVEVAENHIGQETVSNEAELIQLHLERDGSGME